MHHDALGRVAFRSEAENERREEARTVGDSITLSHRLVSYLEGE